MITRRRVVIALGAGALAPLASFSQQKVKVYRIGFLVQTSASVNAPWEKAIQEELRTLGYVDGKNLAIDWRYSEGKVERLPQLATELVRIKPDVLVTRATAAALAAQSATSTIPIVIYNVGDPVGAGLVKSLARPGGNITGLSNLVIELGPKMLEKLREVVPRVTRVCFLVNPTNPYTPPLLKGVQDAAQKLGVKVQPFEASTPQEIANAFAAMARQNAEALMVQWEPFFGQQKNQIVDLAAKQRLPSISGYDAYAEAGGRDELRSGQHGKRAAPGKLY